MAHHTTSANRSVDNSATCEQHASATTGKLCSSDTRRQFLRRCAMTAGAIALPVITPQRSYGAEAVDERLRQLGITLPGVPAPVANYVPWVREDNFVYLAGQIPFLNGELMTPGKVPVDVSIEDARAAARQCGINLIAALNAACEGDLSRVRRCMRLDGFVASAAGFNQQPAVVNGASDLMVEVFGDAGRHSRTAVGVNELPLNACVEVAAVFVINPD